MMKQIAKNTWFSIRRYDETTFMAIRSGRAVLLARTKQGDFMQIAVSEHLSNMSNAVWTTDKKYILLSNTSGKCLLCDGKTFAVLDTFYLHYEPFGNHFIGLRDRFLLIDRNARLCCYDCDTKEISYVSKQGSVVAIKQLRDEIHVFRSDDYVPTEGTKTLARRRMTTVDLPIRIHEGPISRFRGLWKRTAKARADDCIVAEDEVPRGKGFEPMLSVWDSACEGWEHLMPAYRYASLAQGGYFCGCDIDFERDLLAVIFSRAIYIIHMKTWEILQKEPVEYGADICWADDDTLLIATWTGLYVMALTEDRETPEKPQR